MPDFNGEGSAIGATGETGSIQDAKTMPTTRARYEQYMTPGYAPSAAELNASRRYMTAAAPATYFPHG